MGVKVRQKVKGQGQPYWIFINHKGKRTSKKVGDKRAAEQLASKIRLKIKANELNIADNQPSLPTFDLFSLGFMDTYSKLNHAENTRKSYQDMLRLHINPVFGEKRLDEIERKDIKRFIIEKQASGLSANTVKLILSYFSSILSEAVDDELIPLNPTTGVRKVIGKGEPDEINPLSATELNSLLETVQEHFSNHYPLFLLLARTGMRQGEAIGLKWDDIDFNGRFIEVRRSYSKSNYSPTKSRKSRRVDMSPQLTEALLAYRKVSIEKGLRLGIGEPENVFINNSGNPIDIDNWRPRVFNEALKKAKVRKIRIHDLRHTYATLRISKGDNIADVSNQLGHHSVKLTLDTYYHWIPGKLKNEVDALDNLHLSAPQAHPGTKNEGKVSAK
jgi:integrase